MFSILFFEVSLFLIGFTFIFEYCKELNDSGITVDMIAFFILFLFLLFMTSLLQIVLLYFKSSS